MLTCMYLCKTTLNLYTNLSRKIEGDSARRVAQRFIWRAILLAYQKYCFIYELKHTLKYNDPCTDLIHPYFYRIQLCIRTVYAQSKRPYTRDFMQWALQGIGRLDGSPTPHLPLPHIFAL